MCKQFFVDFLNSHSSVPNDYGNTIFSYDPEYSFSLLSRASSCSIYITLNSCVEVVQPACGMPCFTAIIVVVVVIIFLITVGIIIGAVVFIASKKHGSYGPKR